VLAAGYLLWLYQRTAFGEPSPEFSRKGAHAHAAGAAANDEHHDEIEDVNGYEWMAWAPLLAGIVVFGVYPQLMFKIMDPAVEQLTAVFRK
jgi:NADH-quinone oxidoreductase subunit M